MNGSKTLPPFDNEQLAEGVNRYYAEGHGTVVIGKALLAVDGHLVGKVMERQAERAVHKEAGSNTGK